MTNETLFNIELLKIAANPNKPLVPNVKSKLPHNPGLKVRPPHTPGKVKPQSHAYPPMSTGGAIGKYSSLRKAAGIGSVFNDIASNSRIRNTLTGQGVGALRRKLTQAPSMKNMNQIFNPAKLNAAELGKYGALKEAAWYLTPRGLVKAAGIGNIVTDLVSPSQMRAAAGGMSQFTSPLAKQNWFNRARGRVGGFLNDFANPNSSLSRGIAGVSQNFANLGQGFQGMNMARYNIGDMYGAARQGLSRGGRQAAQSGLPSWAPMAGVGAGALGIGAMMGSR